MTISRTIFIYVAISVSWFMAGKSMNFNDYFKIESKLTQEMKTHPTKYQDEFSFGYNIGLIKCSSIAHEVLRK